MSKHYFDRVETIDRLIRIKGTGPPKQFAQKLDIGERTLFEIINLMKELGAPIKYCKGRQSYYYEHEGRFCLKFLKGSDG